MLVHADISRGLSQKSDASDKLPFMSELFEKMGIDANCQPLFDTCAKFNFEQDYIGEWSFPIMDEQVTFGCDEVCHYRSLQLDVVKDNITGKVTISSTGKGWDKTHINWFDKTIEPKKIKNKPPPVDVQKFVNLR